MLADTLEHAEFLRKELDGFRPLSSDAERRIMQKFRLDWNYHSNNIEGNCLSPLNGWTKFENQFSHLNLGYGKTTKKFFC